MGALTFIIYSEITRLRIKNPRHNSYLPSTPPIKSSLTSLKTPNQIQIAHHLQHYLQRRAQHNLFNNALSDYMNFDGDAAPMEELKKRKISRALSGSMEGLLTTEELTHTLVNTMKGDSSPGVDGFIVNHLRVF